jgi:asparagine synthase (glutamine-hydrolysing)
MLFPGFSRTAASLHEITRREGVELRLPFYDVRVANFAWSRPREDLTEGPEQKVILRKAMEGLLPAAVLEPRPMRTGTADSYFRRKAESELPGAMSRFGSELRIAEMGLVDPVLLRRCITEFKTAGPTLQLLIVTACNIETWVRAQNSQIHSARGTGTSA